MKLADTADKMHGPELDTIIIFTPTTGLLFSLYSPNDVADHILKLILDPDVNGKVTMLTKEEGQVVSKNVDVLLS